eukprot:COSAG06_NODE_60488_length_270_cov_2.087719_1_plen_26_part_10
MAVRTVPSRRSNGLQLLLLLWSHQRC